MRRFASGSVMTTKAQGCWLPPLGARTAASRTWPTSSDGTGSALKRRMARCVCMASNRSKEGIAFLTG